MGSEQAAGIDDLEDDPFLPKEASFVPEEKKDDGDATARRNKLRTRFIFVLFSMILAVETGGSMLGAPTTRIFEAKACLQYYELYDKSKIESGGYVPEELCKNKDVQGEVAIVKGYGELFDGLIGVLLAIPYGFLADKYGRKPILCLNIPAFILNMAITGFFMWAKDFSLRWVWISTLAFVIGGGFITTGSLIWTMMADVTTEAQRTTVFFQFGVAAMASDFVSSLATSWLMRYNPWVPMFIGWSLVVIGLLPAFALPETMESLPMKKESGYDYELEQLRSDSEDTSTPTEETYKHTGGLHGLKAKIQSKLAPFAFIYSNRHLLILLSSFVVYRLSRGTYWFLVQYISNRYGWTIADANLLVSLKSILTVALFVAILPGISWVLVSRLHYHIREKDLILAKASIIFLLAGTLTMGIAPSIVFMIIGLVVQTLGIGFVFLTRSLATTMVSRDQTARLYTFIEILQGLGLIIASPLMTSFFTVGLEAGGFWVGLPWIIAAVLFGITAALLWIYRIPAIPRQDEQESPISMI
ncbi:hypothetical protein AJ80_04138 [Polytolypa hystricis UAMH7299]|uniref:Major facilitator superfamily (MFS) profile domain-containing protein n=1 Tax=Polytolypa hystricis (strain UAMH7299) TaxID=1447883 RepID=A0A2B7YDZ2_POLH7|nr:hypothetical protein AJ80_04138 [Polytolypa hystricis UAMH7299]